MNPYTGTYDIGEWRGGQKSTIWGAQSRQRDYEILVREKPIEVTAEEILLPAGWRLRPIRPTEFGPTAEDLTEDERINAADRRRASKKWRGGGGSH